MSQTPKSASDPETVRLLSDYSRSIQRDIQSRGPYGSVSFKDGPPTFLTSPSRSNDASPERDPEVPRDGSGSEIPFYLKAIALSCALLLSFGSHYEAHALGILKSELKENLGISNTQYGVLQSSVALVNTILPIVGGIFVDNLGVELGSLLATSCITVGSFLVAMASNSVSFPLMVLGRGIYGLGSGCIVIVQGAIISQWFTNSGLSFAMGLKITASRLASFLAMATVFPIMSLTGFYGSGLWLAAGLGLLSLMANIGYVLAVKKTQSGSSGNQPKLKEKKDFHPTKILDFQPGFWSLVLLAVTLGGGWNTFLHFVTELLQIRFGKSANEAGYLTAATQVVPLVIPPIVGILQDKVGGRLYLLFVASVGFTASMVLLGFSFVHPIVGILLFSLSLAIGPATIMPGITLIVPSAGVATALGLYKSSLNIATSFQDILVGELQPDNRSTDAYALVMKFMVGIGITATLITMALILADRQQVISINQPENQDSVAEEDLDSDSDFDSDFDSSTIREFYQTRFNQVALVIYGVGLVGSWGWFISLLVAS